VLKRDSLRLLNSLMRCLSYRFIFNIGYRKNIILEFRQGVRKKPNFLSGKPRRACPVLTG
ncbi:MAG: hypothetical protein MUP41_20730, partial [Desulfobacterales bacterium]|nr:hypothetical protein [Desulfobacterales bacterium]